MKRMRIFILIAATILLPFKLSANPVLPDDVGTIEALIDAHKAMKKAEDQQLVLIAANKIEQDGITKYTKLYNDTKTVINKRMNDVNSYLVLATALTSTTAELKYLVEDYESFTKSSFNSVKKYPIAAAYYANTNKQIAVEVKLMRKWIATFASSGVNLLKATMKEKLNVVYQIKGSVSKMRYMIRRAEWNLMTLRYGGMKFYHVEDIINSDLSKDIAAKIIEKWKKNRNI